ncbi:hypothetical protein N7471_004231 [Penicillium samsonianum]|uniref:uncharacterized protein n=1 Tax=Penicillium samsonianum TaxID=1882272 RepID=UPI0025495A3C|nr:uncharacterized protein N7471_004231 [Penicillium samsonianum]KAJ6137745.1 hypothetical protein N7471_004231 [Penicillium samsonianum]
MSTKFSILPHLRSTKTDTVECKIAKTTMNKDKATKTQVMQASEKLPTYEEIAKSSKKNLMDKSEKKIRNAQKPEDLLVHLLSTELSIADKKTLLRGAPMRIYDYNHHRKNAEKVEAQLKNAGYGKLAITLYWCFFWYRVRPRGPESWIKELIELDIEGRWIAQRKAYIQEKDEVVVADGAAAAVKDRGQLMGSKMLSTLEVIVLQHAVAA